MACWRFGSRAVVIADNAAFSGTRQVDGYVAYWQLTDAKREGGPVPAGTTPCA
jgi:hypothetical protein